MKGKKIKEWIEVYTEEAVEIRRTIHKKPELSMQEHITTDFIKQKLKEYGLSIIDTGMVSGAAAVLKGEKYSGKKKGKSLLLRADIDALPMEERSGLSYASQNQGVCHSCGHDIHTAALLLCAKSLSQMRNEISGNVLFLFQPAEENGLGAREVINSGLLKNYFPDMAIAAHCWPDLPVGCVGYKKGSFMASSDIVRLCVKGKGGHGAHPHKSIDPITTAAYIITELQTVITRSVAPLEPAVFTVGRIAGGSVGNVIPDEVIMEGTVRTVNNQTRALIEQRIKTVAEYGAKAMGAECKVDYEKGMPALCCHEEAVALIKAAAEEQLGAENVVMLEEPSMGSEDFANYLEMIPGAMFRIGTSNEKAASQLPLHNAGILFDEKSILTGASVMSQIAINYLQ